MKILLIEDEKELAITIAEYLKEGNYQCEFASDFTEALEEIDLFTYDCILLDIMLPGGDGLKILKELRKSNRRDGIIIISAKNSVGNKIEGLQTGADDYLAKPFHLPELAARIFRIICRSYSRVALFLINSKAIFSASKESILKDFGNLFSSQNQEAAIWFAMGLLFDFTPYLFVVLSLSILISFDRELVCNR